jgi:eukaryotic-like serine/threonine-protein kinase
MPINPGQKLGDYEVIDVLESSKIGVTYKVRNVLLQRFEALRVLPKAFQDDQERVTRFLREAKVHARISHSNVVAFYHATQLEGQLVMTTELVEGTTLAQRLELGPLPLAEALAIFSQILTGLACTHSLGVVHRDITPSNIILLPDGCVKLTGFAMAKATTDPQLTQPGTMMGSLHYISPEQVKAVNDLDARTDIYSLGVVLYEAVTGRKPFEHKSQFDVMLAHVSEMPVSPGVLKPELPAELSEIILRAMAKDPQSRFQNADEFRARIDHLAGIPQPVSALPVAEVQPTEQLASAEQVSTDETVDTPMVRRWSSPAIVAAALFTILVAMWAFFFVLRGY